MKKPVIFLLLLLYSFTTYAQNNDSSIGLPFNILTPDSVVKKIVIAEITNFRGFNFKIDSFKSKKNHKVLAVNYELMNSPLAGGPYYYLNTWGAAWEYSTLEEAKKEAIEEIKKPSTYRPGTILFLMIDDSLNIPNELFDNYKKMEQEIANDDKRKFQFANKTVPLNDAFDLTKFAVDVQNGFSGNRGDSIRLNPYFPVRIGYPDSKQDYAAACQDRILYALQKVDIVDTSFFYNELRQLSQRGLYGTYSRSISTVLNFKTEVKGRLIERISKFSSHLNVQKDSIEVTLPSNLRHALQNETISEMWVEGTVRVTDDGIPLEKDTLVKPLAVLTDKGLYISIEIRMPNTGVYCALSEDFHNKIIDVTVYKKDEESRNKVYSTLMKNLEIEFAKAPLSAQKISKLYPPGEMWMIRDGLPSLVLGNPYWESSTYTFKVYYGGERGDFENVYDRESFKGVSKRDIYAEHAYIFLQVANVTSSKPHKNDVIYAEVNKDEQAKYFKAINDAIKRAVQHTCEELKGNMSVSICNIK